MISCRATRRRLLDVVRRTASDAVRLEIESHLDQCASCRLERARWGLFGLLKDQPTAHLSLAAERRIISHLVQTPPLELVRRTVAPRAHSRGLLVGFAVAALAVGAVVFSSVRHGGPRRDTAGVAEGQRFDETESGAISFGGARVEYEPGTKMVVHPARRQLILSSGIIQVDVTEGLPGRFRVATRAFIVEVLGTRFVVTPMGVQTLRGHVRILDLQGRELAVLQAGESWTMPAVEKAQEPTLAPPPPERASLPPELASAPPPPPQPMAVEAIVAAAPSARQRPASAVIHPPAPVTRLLSLTRAALAEGDAVGARTWIERARAGNPSAAETAAADLLEADAWLVARQPERAIAAYQGVYRRRPNAAEGEMAAFAVGQLLAERDSPIEAAAALNEYLAHYPRGRFVREARERLGQLQPGP